MSLKVLAIAATLALSSAPVFAEEMKMDMSKPMGDHGASSHALRRRTLKCTRT